VIAPREGTEGLRGWVAELDRKVGLRTYVGLALVILSVATAVVAIVLAIDARDNSARNQDLNQLSDQVASSAAATQTAEDDVNALDGRVAALENQLGSDTGAAAGAAGDLDKRLATVESDIQDLRGQITDLQNASGGSSGGSKP
jgi:hypothetical protein